MSKPRFILAKYAPDLSRMEPRNIGIFLWNKGKIVSQFLPDNEIPFVKDIKTYKEWTVYWQEMTNGSVIDAPGLEPESLKSEDCLNALLTTEGGNYLLVDAGFIPRKLPVKDMDKAINFLFSELVASPTSDSPESSSVTSFAKQCEAIFDTIGLEVGNRFKKNEKVECPVYGSNRHLNCNYYLGNGHPEGILQRAKLSSEQHVSSAAMVVHAVTDKALVPKNKCRFLVRSCDINTEIAEENYKFLSKVCEVIDVDKESATGQVSDLVESLGMNIG